MKGKNHLKILNLHWPLYILPISVKMEYIGQLPTSKFQLKKFNLESILHVLIPEKILKLTRTQKIKLSLLNSPYEDKNDN